MRIPNATTKQIVVGDGVRDALTAFGCGQCMPCRINKSREWTHRLLLEQRVHKESAFVTLTYDNDHIPEGGNLSPRHVTLYLKKLRRYIEPYRLRYFAVGEYGEKTWRPHYHMALFGLGINHSKIIDKKWEKGLTMTGDLTKDSARYMVGYVTKKMTKKSDPRLKGREPEFMRSSRGSRDATTGIHSGGLGLPAIRKIASHLKKNVHYSESYINSLRYGKKEMPLGRYLTEKLAELTGGEDWSEEFYHLQSQDFNENIGKGKIYYEEVIKNNAPKAHAIEKRNKIFKHKRKI